MELETLPLPKIPTLTNSLPTLDLDSFEEVEKKQLSLTAYPDLLQKSGEQK